MKAHIVYRGIITYADGRDRFFNAVPNASVRDRPYTIIDQIIEEEDDAVEITLDRIELDGPMYENSTRLVSLKRAVASWRRTMQ